MGCGRYRTPNEHMLDDRRGAMTWPVRRNAVRVGSALLAAVALSAIPTAATAGAQGRSGVRAGMATPAPVPNGFKANSVTWLSPARGWVLGAAPCGTKTCSDVIGTTDGSKTWALLGAVGAPIARSGLGGITEIRFATPKVGWAFGPDLYRTTDGGRSFASTFIDGVHGRLIPAVVDVRTGAVREPIPTGDELFDIGGFLWSPASDRLYLNASRGSDSGHDAMVWPIAGRDVSYLRLGGGSVAVLAAA